MPWAARERRRPRASGRVARPPRRRGARSRRAAPRTRPPTVRKRSASGRANAASWPTGSRRVRRSSPPSRARTSAASSRRARARREVRAACTRDARRRRRSRCRPWPRAPRPSARASTRAPAPAGIEHDARGAAGDARRGGVQPDAALHPHRQRDARRPAAAAARTTCLRRSGRRPRGPSRSGPPRRPRRRRALPRATSPARARAGRATHRAVSPASTTMVPIDAGSVRASIAMPAGTRSPALPCGKHREPRDRRVRGGRVATGIEDAQRAGTAGGQRQRGVGKLEGRNRDDFVQPLRHWISCNTLSRNGPGDVAPHARSRSAASPRRGYRMETSSDAALPQVILPMPNQRLVVPQCVQVRASWRF